MPMCASILSSTVVGPIYVANGDVVREFTYRRDVRERLRIVRNYRQRDQELVEVWEIISFPYNGPH